MTDHAENWVLILSRGYERDIPETVIPGYASRTEAEVAGAAAVQPRAIAVTNYASFRVLPGRGAASLCQHGAHPGAPHSWDRLSDGRKICRSCGVVASA
jgi:hypothetical protein